MASPLENLTGPGKPLRKEPPDAKEFSRLKRSALARLTDLAKISNSLESRFDLAYNAAHALRLAALRWHGFRPANRYTVFQVLPPADRDRAAVQSVAPVMGTSESSQLHLASARIRTFA
jgi:hypothetical protein